MMALARIAGRRGVVVALRVHMAALPGPGDTLNWRGLQKRSLGDWPWACLAGKNRGKPQEAARWLGHGGPRKPRAGFPSRRALVARPDWFRFWSPANNG